MDLALNNLQRLLYHKTHLTQPNQTENKNIDLKRKKIMKK